MIVKLENNFDDESKEEQRSKIRDQLETRANIDKARRVLGYRPNTGAHDGLAREVAWYREEIFGKVDL